MFCRTICRLRIRRPVGRAVSRTIVGLRVRRRAICRTVRRLCRVRLRHGTVRRTFRRTICRLRSIRAIRRAINRAIPRLRSIRLRHGTIIWTISRPIPRLIRVGLRHWPITRLCRNWLRDWSVCRTIIRLCCIRGGNRAIARLRSIRLRRIRLNWLIRLRLTRTITRLHRIRRYCWPIRRIILLLARLLPRLPRTVAHIPLCALRGRPHRRGRRLGSLSHRNRRLLRTRGNLHRRLRLRCWGWLDLSDLRHGQRSPTVAFDRFLSFFERRRRRRRRGLSHYCASLQRCGRLFHCRSRRSQYRLSGWHYVRLPHLHLCGRQLPLVHAHHVA
jgi:hypothetical protein